MSARAFSLYICISTKNILPTGITIVILWNWLFTGAMVFTNTCIFSCYHGYVKQIQVKFLELWENLYINHYSKLKINVSMTKVSRISGSSDLRLFQSIAKVNAKVTFNHNAILAYVLCFREINAQKWCLEFWGFYVGIFSSVGQKIQTW